MKTIEDLKNIYLNILSEVDSSFFDKKHEQYDKNLSGLFLTSFHPDYFESNTKIMLVGVETRGWNVYKNFELLEVNYNLENYINGAINRHQMEIEEILNTPISNKREFYNLFKKIIRKTGNKNIIYNNLFCRSYKEKSPIGTVQFNAIKELSKKLFLAELKFYQPNIIIFANGLNSANFRKEIFPLEKCINRMDFIADGIPNKQLWQFSFDDYLCYRLTHPSARGNLETMQIAQAKLIDLLPENCF